MTTTRGAVYTWRTTPDPGPVVAGEAARVGPALHLSDVDVSGAPVEVAALPAGALIDVRSPARPTERWSFVSTGAPVALVGGWSVPITSAGHGPDADPDDGETVFLLLVDPYGVTSTWATVDDARTLWPDAVALDDATLTDLLAAAYVVCSRFAAPSIATDPEPPAMPDAGIVGVRRLANVYEARELWAASRRDGDVIGFDSYAVRVRPLSATVQSLLRPSRGGVMTG